MLNWPDVVYHTIGDEEERIPTDTAVHGSLFWRTVTTLDPRKDIDQQIRDINERVERES
jgi:hypothetical protein